MARRQASLAEIRGFYARQLASASRLNDPRLARIFELVPREAFLPPGPWKILVTERYLETPSADPAYLYQNTLVALDADRGINNGEPFLHASWIGAVAPQPGETITHIGAGTGYYSAILSMLVLPGGRLNAFEIHEELAEAARRNLCAIRECLRYRGQCCFVGVATVGPDLCECRRDRATQAMAGRTPSRWPHDISCPA